MIGKTMTFLVVAFFSNVAWAGDAYRGSLESTNLSGRTVTWQLDLALTDVTAADVKGTLRIWGAGPCQGEQPISGTRSGSEIEFVVAEHQVKGCGGNTFKGRLEESQVVGKLFFQKKFHDVVLKKL